MTKDKNNISNKIKTFIERFKSLDIGYLANNRLTIYRNNDEERIISFISEEIQKAKEEERERVIDELFIRKDGYFRLVREEYLIPKDIEAIRKYLNENNE